MPDRLIIVNTSPLVYLHRIRQIELLPTLYGAIVVPSAVQAELRIGIKAGFPAPDVEQLSWVRTKAVQSQTLIPVIVDLGPGEAEVIALGLECPGSLLIIDDRLARKVASLNHLTFTGTLGILLKAKQVGHLKSIAPLIEALRASGLWLSDDLVEAVLAQAGET